MEELELEIKSSSSSRPPPIEGMADDIIWDIFCRLPTKACLNCKLVCKRWYALIITPEFSAQRRARGRYISLLFISGFHPNFMLLDLDTTSSDQQLIDGPPRSNLIIPSEHARIIFKPKLRRRYRNAPEKLKPVNECNGLLCFKTHACWSSFMIFNLLTAQQVTVVKQPYKVGYRLVSCAWGYSPVSHQYKILRILKRRGRGPSDCVAEIHTLGTHEWRCVDANNDNAPGELSFQLNAFLNGSLIHGFSRSPLTNRIWSFNFDTEQFSLVPLSHEIMSAGVIVAVTTFESFLCCTTTNRYSPGINFYEDAVNQVWIMKQYGNKDSWVNLYVSLPFRSPYPLFRSMNNGEYILVSFAGEELDTLCSQNFVLGAYSCRSRGYHWLRVMLRLFYVLACDTTFSLLPMKLMQEQLKSL